MKWKIVAGGKGSKEMKANQLSVALGKQQISHMNNHQAASIFLWFENKDGIWLNIYVIMGLTFNDSE